MEPDAENEVHSIPSHEYERERDHVPSGEREGTHPPGVPRVQNGEVTEKRDQRPDFLRIPSPEAAPGIVGPDPAENRSCGEQDDAELDRAIRELVEHRDLLLSVL